MIGTAEILCSVLAASPGVVGPSAPTNLEAPSPSHGPALMTHAHAKRRSSPMADAGPAGLAGGSLAFSALTDQWLSSDTTASVIPASALMFGLSAPRILSAQFGRAGIAPRRRWSDHGDRTARSNNVHGALSMSRGNVSLTLRGRF